MSATEIQVPVNKESKRHESTCFYLFAAGILVGVIQLSRPIPFGAGFEMVAIAKNLAAHGSYANPFWVLKTGPTAANPPLYPLILAALIKIFRLPALVLTMASVGNIVMNALTASLLPRISRLLLGSMISGVIASIFWLGSVLLMPAWDVSYTTALLLALVLYSESVSQTQRRPIAFGLLEGAMAGALFLFNPASVLIVCPWVVYLLLRHKMLLKEAIVLFVASTLVVSVWMVRNKIQFGDFSSRSAFGMTFYASNNDCAQASRFSDELNNCYQSHHPNTSLFEARLLLSMGEPRYDHMRLIDTERWIKAHPHRFAVLTLERFRDFWFPPLRWDSFTSLVIWIATALSIPGLVLMFRRRERLVWFMLSVLFIYPLIYYIVVSDVRYRYPVLWLSLLPAGYFLHNSFPNWPGMEASETGESGPRD